MNPRNSVIQMLKTDSRLKPRKTFKVVYFNPEFNSNEIFLVRNGKIEDYELETYYHKSLTANI